MMMLSPRIRAFTFAALCLSLIGGPGPALAEDTSALDKIVELNRRALQAYADLDMETSLKLLKQAAELCNVEGLERHRAAARTHVHLGVVYLSGLRLRDQALTEFRRAIGIDPTIKITKTLSTSEVQTAFAEAIALGPEAPPSSVSPSPSPATKPPVERAQSMAASRPAKETGIHHPPVTEAVSGKAVEIKVQIPPSLSADKVMLAYRVGGEGEFLAREMRPIENAPEWYHEKIPAEAVKKDDVSYYIEVQDADGQALMASGAPGQPYKIRVTSAIAERATEGLATTAKPGEGESSSPLWFVLAAGVGGGYFSGTPEMNSVGDSGKPLQSKGTELAAIGHLAPEVGYFYSEHLLLSLQGRFQYVTGSNDVTYNGKTYKTSKFALAVLAKASYFLTEPSARFQPFLALQAGFGEIRYPVATSPLLGCGPNGAAGSCKDTVRGGPGLLGASAGVVYMLGDSLGVYASLSGLAGVPDVAFNADFNLGVALVR